jgi:argininosuccinate synthase
MDTSGPSLSYHPEKLSMERVGDAAFGPIDRIGQLTMRNLDIADSRTRLEQYAHLGLVGGAVSSLVGELQPGEARGITELTATVLDAEVEQSTDRGGMDAGTD